MSRLPFTAAQFVDKLAGQVGTTEHPAGSNRTPYGAAVGLDGVPWCAILPAWAWGALGAPWRAWWGLSGTYWAYCPTLLTEGKARGLAVSVEDVRAGDLVFEAFSSRTIAMRYPEHIETATGPLSSTHLVPTIGGNTSSGDNGSQSNGGGVFRRQRARSLVVGVIRPPFAVPARPATPARPSRSPAPRRPVTVPAIGRLLYDATPDMHGLDVLNVQRRVGVKADGWFGPKTAAAVRAFQRRWWPHDPRQWDGKVGPATTRALGMRWTGR